jgi:hypothetical protein
MATACRGTLAVVLAGLGFPPAGGTGPFCKTWARLDDEARRARVYALADDFLTTHPDRALADSLRTCMRERTDELVKKEGGYYLCDNGDDFTAGKIIGQVQGTGLALCLRQLRTGRAG